MLIDQQARNTQWCAEENFELVRQNWKLKSRPLRRDLKVVALDWSLLFIIYLHTQSYANIKNLGGKEEPVAHGYFDVPFPRSLNVVGEGDKRAAPKRENFCLSFDPSMDQRKGSEGKPDGGMGQLKGLPEGSMG